MIMHKKHELRKQNQSTKLERPMNTFKGSNNNMTIVNIIQLQNLVNII